MVLELMHGDIESSEKDRMCLYQLSFYLFLACVPTRLNLHQLQFSKRKICLGLKNFGIGIFSKVLVVYRQPPNGVNLPYEVFRYGHDQYRRLQNVFIVLFRDLAPNEALWFANMLCEMFLCSLGYFVRILIFIIMFLIQPSLVGLIMLVIAINVVVSRSVNKILQMIHFWFTLVPCCIPWYVKRPVLVEDHHATSELCLNSPFTGSCTCNLNFPKRPVPVVDDTGSSGLTYG